MQSRLAHRMRGSCKTKGMQRCLLRNNEFCLAAAPDNARSNSMVCAALPALAPVARLLYLDPLMQLLLLMWAKMAHRAE